jgi:hypothetical protein
MCTILLHSFWPSKKYLKVMHCLSLYSMALDNHSSIEMSSYLNCWVERMLLIKLWKLISCNFLFLFRQRRSCGSQSLESHYWGHEIWSPCSSCSCSLLSLLNSFSWCCVTELLLENYSVMVVSLWDVEFCPSTFTANSTILCDK